MSKLIELRVTGFKSLDNAVLVPEEQGCTSLVGANNAGKSSLLRSLAVFFNPTLTITEDERRRGYPQDPIVECVFQTTGYGKVLGSDFPPGQKFRVSRDLVRAGAYTIHDLPTSQTRPINLSDFTQISPALPSFLQLRASSFPYNQVIGAEPQDAAVRILIKKFQLGSPSATVARLQSDERAKKEVYQISRDVWKSSDIGPFNYVSAGNGVIFTIAAAEGRFCALSDMGDGIQRALSVALQIDDLRSRANDQDLLLVIDEPENSLHPRAQRDLFTYLSTITKAQVLCATHSPCMIDTSRPSSIRTLSLDRKLGATRILDRKHIADNLETVRLALGILPTDSLSFGLVNVIVEGAIDLLVYPIWVETLRKDKRVDLDLSLVRFLSGGGPSTPIYFQIAVSTGMPTVAILDNDNAGRAYAGKIRAFAGERYNLDYEAVHLLKTDGTDSDLESTLPEGRLVERINQRCQPQPQITAEDLSRNKAVKKSKNIEDFLRAQGIEFDMFKTEITLEVARAMGPGEIPRSAVEAFEAIARLLSGTDQHVRPKER
jgi:energy-coupling factor transporter ATP-binding protein EcfA2